MPIRIAIADDHRVFVDGIVSLLVQHASFEIVGTYFDGQSILDSQEIRKADVLLLDISMPHISGFEICQSLLKTIPHLKILILSMHDNDNFIRKAFKVGAMGYLLKNTDKEELIEAIMEISKGKHFYTDAVFKALLNNSPSKRPTSTIPSVTRREKEVLEYIARGYTNPQIAEKMFVTIKAIEFHRSSLLSKFGVNNAVMLIQKAQEWQLI